MSKNIEKIIYINLERRTDRKQEIEKELAEKGLQFERFNAIQTITGCVGCTLSHIQVLKLAKERGYKNVLVLEDDFMFLVDKHELESNLEQFFELNIPYDVCMLSYNLIQSESVANVSCVGKVLEAQAASGYLVNSAYYDTLIELWESAVVQLEKTGEHWLYTCDQIWKTLQKKDNWYYFRTRLGKQRPSWSDLGNRFMDYGM